MLVLSRKYLEVVVVGGMGTLKHMLKVTVLGISGDSVKLGFDVDPAVPVHRLEVWQRLQGNGTHNGPPIVPRAASVNPARPVNDGGQGAK
jgi:carbon storage regulator CsrA